MDEAIKQAIPSLKIKSRKGILVNPEEMKMALRTPPGINLPTIKVKIPKR